MWYLAKHKHGNIFPCHKHGIITKVNPRLSCSLCGEDAPDSILFQLSLLEGLRGHSLLWYCEYLKKNQYGTNTAFFLDDRINGYWHHMEFEYIINKQEYKSIVSFRKFPSKEKIEEIKDIINQYKKGPVFIQKMI